MSELLILSSPPGATIQDAGRTGWMHAGVPPSGPLDPTAHAAANLAVGNDPRAATLEVPLGSLFVRAGGDVAVSIDGERGVRLDDRTELVVQPCERAVRYLAVAGGFDVAPVLGSRSTLLVARLGGWKGRPVRAGDALPVGTPEGRPLPRVIPIPPDPADAPVLWVVPGPHLARFPQGALERLLEATWRVSARSDRVGTRLEADERVPRLGDDRAAPAPMIRGAVQITTDGTPIVLGPDHPVTGGYPVIAVVGRASQAILVRLRAKRLVRFALAPSG